MWTPPPEPARPPEVESLQKRLADGAAREAVVAEADAAVVDWKWAVPWISVEPLLTECLFGRSSRWRTIRPRPDTGVAVGTDATERIRVIHPVTDQPLPVREVFRHESGKIEGWTIGDATDHALQWWIIQEGRIIESFRAGPQQSWDSKRFTCDAAGRVALIEERFWICQSNAMTWGGEMRYAVTYDAEGTLDTILLHRLWDESKRWAFQADPPSGRAQQIQLDGLVRDGLVQALSRIRNPATVRAVCVFTSSTNPDPPVVYVGRSERLADLSTVDLDDLSPPEWYSPPEDVFDLSAFGTWPTFEDDVSVRRLRRAIRTAVTTISPADLGALPSRGDAPLLFAMDTERTEAPQNLRDAFGPEIAHGILRRARAAGHL